MSPSLGKRLARIPVSDLSSAMSTVKLIRGDEVLLEPTLWVWKYYIPAGQLILLAGQAGCGKTTLVLLIASIMTRGGLWPDGTRFDVPCDVLCWSGEDSNAGLKARLVASGADLRRIRFVGDVGALGEARSFDPASDMALLQAAAESSPSVPRLLIIDPIVSAVSGDSHKNAEVRRSLQPVVDFARTIGCAVIGITHLSKGTSGRDPSERINGSLAFAALARVVLIATKISAKKGSEEDIRAMVRAKSNIGPDNGGFYYSLERIEVAPGVEGQRAVWGDEVTESASTVLARAESTDNTETDSDGDGHVPKSEVDLFLRDFLGNGVMVPSNEVKAAAREVGYAWRTVHNAAKRIDVTIKKNGMSGGWYWSLPRIVDPRNLEFLVQPPGATNAAPGISDGEVL